MAEDEQIAEDQIEDSEQEEIANLDRLVAEAKTLALGREDGIPLADLVDTFWRLVPDEDLGTRTAEQMLAAVETHLALAQQRLKGELKIEIEQTDDQTVVLILTDDMPFLVDSVTAAVSGAGLELGLLAHPQMVVRREALGRLIEVRPGVEPDDAGPDDMVESWMRVEVGRIRDDAALTELRNTLQRVLTDVREAVEDWPRMRSRALALADELATAVLPVPDKDITDSVALLRWLADDHFTFLGYREYRIVERPGGEQVLEAVLGTGLGILRRDPVSARKLSSLSPEAYARVMEKRLLIITKANSRSTVHRSAYLDYIGFKVFDNNGNVIGERRFLGLFSSAAYLSSVKDLPVVKRKVAEVVARSGLSPRSHSGKDLMAILEDYPREELFQITTDDLFRTVMGVLRLAGRRQVRLFARKDHYGRFISCLVYLPKDRFNTANRLKIQEILLRELRGIGLDYATRVGDSTLARIHFIVRTDAATSLGEIDAEALSRQIADATRLWEDDFATALERKLGDGQARALVERYGSALPEIYKDSHTADEAVQDLAKLELLEEPRQLVLHLFRRRKNDSDVRFKMFRLGEPMTLSDVLPVLHSLGVRVRDERPYEVRRSDATLYIYDFGLSLPEGCRDITEVRAKAENAFAAAWRGESEVDDFNALVLKAGLTWRQVVVLRAYAKYLRQVGSIYSHEYVESTLVANPDIAAQLVRLFETRLDPALGLSLSERNEATQALTAEIRASLDRVASLDQDRILRSYLTLIHATLRTSFFQRSEDGRPKPYVAFKLDPRAIPDLPQPRPLYEIFVYSPHFEGVHLRFGTVARGGVRWSDRREDFRTEVLGLVKAQMVKNAVIVPEGAKGGFVLKKPPAERDRLQAEAELRYREFISAMLDITDNIVGGEVVVPEGVVRHDGDDPYLVVAADKGTAAFSDIANEISKRYGYWLDDAFASGGSAGYDHKGMGITARGAWESVKRHFREMGVDVETQDFTVVGIGDMSGDVFGNGMLRSEHIRLVAAFDHRHIFVDPTPDAASSFRERQRLFHLPRSTWDDYDRSLISPGGGVWPRTAKAIPVSPQMRAALGIEDDSVTTLSPPELIQAILRAPVDLLWNGGIGTYVKASTESHLDVGDKANDAVRVNGSEVRAKVVGEGGNLGFTQRGRIEYALFGGQMDSAGRQARLRTDFIDNSAGVDCSDHEVNIKILLGAAESAGELTRSERDQLLEEMTDEVAELVLRTNYEQAQTLGASLMQAAQLLPVHRRMINEMERAGQLDRNLEALPTEKELDARTGIGLTMPELAVLLAYSKMVAARSILDSSLPDEEWTASVLREYFPTPVRARFEHLMPGLRLRREIVTTSLVNEAINRGGISFLFRAVEETGASVDDVLRAYVVVRDVFGLRDLWRAVEALDGKVPADAQTAVYLDVRRLMDRAVRWVVANRRTPIYVPGERERFGPVATLLARLDELVRGRDRKAVLQRAAELTELGIPADVASWAARLTYGFGLLDVVEVAHTTGRDLDEVAGVYFLLSDEFRVDHLLSKISALPREDRWQTLARMALRYDLYAALAALTAEVLAVAGPEVPTEEKVRAWEAANLAGVTRTRHAIDEFDGARPDLASLSVLLRQIRSLVRASAARAAR
ncbi:MAG TPA: NAD-glutamate dehydrogenase [Micromonosporaceae bacterium]|nr:NAD-glutamate dehydrogenase [Micromonosporaceae bacterium]